MVALVEKGSPPINLGLYPLGVSVSRSGLQVLLVAFYGIVVFATTGRFENHGLPPWKARLHALAIDSFEITPFWYWSFDCFICRTDCVAEAIDRLSSCMVSC